MKRTNYKNGVPNEIRTRVTAVKGRCPRPLDDGDKSYLLTTYFNASSAYRDGLHFFGARRDRTADLLHAMQALSQLSYSPACNRVAILGRPAAYVNLKSA
jgi:hypothetical protein